MKGKKAWVLLEKKTRKMVWIGLKRPRVDRGRGEIKGWDVYEVDGGSWFTKDFFFLRRIVIGEV